MSVHQVPVTPMLCAATLMVPIHVPAMVGSLEMEWLVRVSADSYLLYFFKILLLYYSDINECVSVRPCDSNATCIDTPGSFNCTCNGGFTGNGMTCQSNNSFVPFQFTRTLPPPLPLDINECITSPCNIDATCTETPGSFTCTCNSGFTGNGFICQSN